MKPRPIKHGTIYAYKIRGCRCRPCKTANTETCIAERRRRGVQPRETNPCRFGRRLFASQVEAARETGKAESTINYHLDRYGNLDRIGGKRGGRGNIHGKEIRIGTREWPSMAALERELGVTGGTVARWIKRGDMNALVAAVMGLDAGRMAA